MKKLLLIFIVCSALSSQAQDKTYNCFYQLNSAEYGLDSIAKLDNWLSLHVNTDYHNLEIVAYTDTIGSIEYNDRLANKRLENVAEILKSKGYDIRNAQTIGKRYTTKQYSNNADFRKVEIQVFESPPEIVWVENEPTLEEEEIEEVEEVFEIQKPQAVIPIVNRMAEFEALGDNKIINLNIEFKNSTNVYRNQKSEEQVFHLAEYLKKYPKKKVLILGHVCCSNNYAVSNSRAKKVYDDLVKYKINKKRLKYKGMSNTHPLVEEVNASAEQKNRRVEVMFYEK